jgi:hypothetical protein
MGDGRQPAPRSQRGARQFDTTALSVPRKRVLCEPASAMRFFPSRHIWLRRAATIAAVLFSAFVLVSAVMFWLPYFQRAVGREYGYSYTDSGSYDLGSYGDTLGYYGTQLKKLSPADERPLLDAVSGDFRQKTNAELFQLKAYEDVCAIDVVDCRGLTAAKVKPFIDAILSDRQSAENALSAHTANNIAAGSLFISLVALIFTALGYQKRAVRTPK